MAGDAWGEGEHFVLFPYMAHGHVTPFLALADLLHRLRPSAAITLVSTPANVAPLRSSLPASSPVVLRPLTIPSADYGLPAGAEHTNALPFHLLINLFRASEALLPAFRSLLLSLSGSCTSLCVITDNFLAWTVGPAREAGASHAVFLTGGAYGTVVYNSLWRHLPHAVAGERNEFPLPDFPHITIHRSGLPGHLLAADGSDGWSVFLRGQLRLCSRSDAILSNTAPGLEPAGISMLRSFYNLPVYPIGPLIGRPSSPANNARCLDWLRSQPARSVLYISFGSQNTITLAQMRALAAGLEASGRRFLWVVRPPVGHDINGEFTADWLPPVEGSGRGMVIRGWAPQRAVLEHKATAAFLSHCGWNSVLESLCSGVPIIAWPLSGDQLYNATMLEREAGVAVEVARTNKDSVEVDGERVRGVIEMVMGDKQKGNEMRRRAGEVRDMLAAAAAAGGSSARNLAEFLSVGLKGKASLK